MISAGRLREQVTIQEKNLVDNGKGGRKPVGSAGWVNVTEEPIRAQIEPIRGQEAVQYGVERSSTLYRVTMRARAGITPAQRLLWASPLGTIAMELTAPPALSRDRRDMVLTCEGKLA